MSQAGNVTIAEARLLMRGLLGYGPQCRDDIVIDAAVRLIVENHRLLDVPSIWRRPIPGEHLPPNIIGEVFLFDVPEADRACDFDDIAERYAVEIDDAIPGGRIVFGLYRGQWLFDVCHRWLVSRLIGDRR